MGPINWSYVSDRARGSGLPKFKVPVMIPTGILGCEPEQLLGPTHEWRTDQEVRVLRDEEQRLLRDVPRVMREGYGGVAATAVPVAEGSITERVNRCLMVAEALEQEARELMQRTVNPGRIEVAKNGPSAPEPDPSHVVFALEKLERVLDRTRRHVNGTAEAL